MILYTSWYSLLGHALMISRPGYTTFAMRTHTYRRNFVAVCADHNTSLCDDGWFDGSPVSPAVCSSECCVVCTTDENNKRQHHANYDHDAGRCLTQPNAPQERIKQELVTHPVDNPTIQDCFQILRHGSISWALSLATRRGDHNNFPDAVGMATRQQDDFDAMMQRCYE